MSRYEMICKLDKDFILLINKGLLPVHLLAWKTIYEAYKYHIQENKKMVTYLFLADFFNLSETQIRNIIKFMAS